jgi:hypothetical protein
VYRCQEELLWMECKILQNNAYELKVKAFR